MAALTDWINGGRLDLLLDLIKVATDNLPVTPKKNVALSNVPFKMVDATDHITPETARSVTGTISKDGGAFSALTNAEVEIANGWYKINVTQTEMNADVIILKFTASGADQTEVVLLTDA